MDKKLRGVILTLTAKVLTLTLLGSEVAISSCCAVIVCISWGSCTLIVAAVGSSGRVTLLILRPISGPIDAISEGFTAAAENREGPEPAIAAEDLFPILLRGDIVQRLIGVTLHF